MKAKKLLIPLLIVGILVGAFYVGGNAPGSRGWQVEEYEPAPVVTTLPPTAAIDPVTTEAPAATLEPPATEEKTSAPEALVEPSTTAPEKEESTTTGPEKEEPAVNAATESQMEINPETGKDRYMTDPVPAGKPKPVEPQDVIIGDKAYTCTISINCASILNNLDLCDPEKVELIPEEGWILLPTQVTFYEGESVFNVLNRICKQQKIHMEFENTPIYNSAYIEGICNLYEFDVGELSGWMYKVNEWFPNYGCSRYQLSDGDVICWVYTCDMGKDVGGGHAAGNSRG